MCIPRHGGRFLMPTGPESRRNSKTLDIRKILDEQIAKRNARSAPERARIYEAFRFRIIELASRQGLTEDHARVRLILDQLALAVDQIEARLADPPVARDFSDPAGLPPLYPAEAVSAPDAPPLATHAAPAGPVPARRRTGLAGAGLALAAMLMAGAAWYVFQPSQTGAGTGDSPRTVASSNTAGSGNAVLSLSGSALSRFKTNRGSVIEPSGEALRMSSTLTKATSAGRTGGAYLQLEPAIEKQVSGHTITVTLEARPAAKSPSPQFFVAYSTAAAGNSGWRKFAVRNGTGTYSFDYAVPSQQDGFNSDYLGIWADPEGKGRGIDLLSVSIRIKE